MENVFLSLVRLGIGTSGSVYLPERINWDEIQALANKQGLSAIVLDGLEELKTRYPDLILPEKQMLTQWIGGVLKEYESRYESYCHAIAGLAGFFNRRGLKMMVIKGYACSLNWPKPEHRPAGDIDIWQFGDYKRADALLTAEKGIIVDRSHHHHTVFCWHGFSVENHYDFINVHHHKSHVALEKILKEQAQDDSRFEMLFGEKVYLPSPNLHALFLLKHMMLHFASGKLTLRQVLDWAFFVEKHGTIVDWGWLLGVLKDFKMYDFFDIINSICVDNLGFDAKIFPETHFTSSSKERVAKDILCPEFKGPMPKQLFPRISWKIRRWKANRWKHEICYKETMWSAFWSGVWNHLLKPASI